jgi:hypothetical protein
MDGLIAAAAWQIIGLSQADCLEPSHVLQLNTPIEDGGFGILPLEVVHKFLLGRGRDRAALYAAKFGFDLYQRSDDEQAPSLSYIWRKRFKPQYTATQLRSKYAASATRAAMSDDGFKSWLTAWPSNYITTLDDPAFRFGCRFKLQLLRPRSYKCLKIAGDTKDLSQRDYTRHVLTCCYCANHHYRLRHERVGSITCRTLRYYGVVANHNPVGFPKPGNAHGGPDALVYTDVAWAVDFAVCHPEPIQAYGGAKRYDRLSHKFTVKSYQYEEFSDATGFKIMPFIVDTDGVIHPRTRSLLENWRDFIGGAIGRKFMADLQTNVQMEVIRGLCFGVQSLHARAVAETIVLPEAGENGESGNNGGGTDAGGGNEDR